MNVFRALWQAVDEGRSKKEVEADIAEEFRHHIERCAQALETEGLSPDEAWREARRRFGDAHRHGRRCLRENLGLRNMLQKVHLAVTLLLLGSILVMAWRNAHLAMEMEEAAMEAKRLAVLHLERGFEAVEPVEHLTIRVGDAIEVVDLLAPEIQTSETVSLEGKILIPELGWFHVAGMTREQAEQELKERLKPYFVATDPRLKVRR